MRDPISHPNPLVTAAGVRLGMPHVTAAGMQFGMPHVTAAGMQFGMPHITAAGMLVFAVPVAYTDADGYT